MHRQRVVGLNAYHVQALVEHCVATGAAATVERCVLRLDITTLDLNQVLG